MGPTNTVLEAVNVNFGLDEHKKSVPAEPWSMFSGVFPGNTVGYR